MNAETLTILFLFGGAVLAIILLQLNSRRNTRKRAQEEKQKAAEPAAPSLDSPPTRKGQPRK